MANIRLMLDDAEIEVVVGDSGVDLWAEEAVFQNLWRIAAEREVSIDSLVEGWLRDLIADEEKRYSPVVNVIPFLRG